VWYTSGYAQDEWRPRTKRDRHGRRAGRHRQVRQDRVRQPTADALTFRDQSSNLVQYNTAPCQDLAALSPRAGFNWDVMGDQRTQVRGGTACSPASRRTSGFSNQIGNTGMLTGFVDSVTADDLIPVQSKPRCLQADVGDRRATRPAPTSR